MGEPETRTLVRRMALNRTEFLRSFPAAAGSLPWRIEGSRILVEDAPRLLEISLSPQSPRSMGALVLPQTDVSLRFEGFTTEAVDAFLRRFDLAFQRGGG
jgi:hypothetical protein